MDIKSSYSARCESVEEAVEEIFQEAKEKYPSLVMEDIVFKTVQEPHKGLFSNKQAIVTGEISQEAFQRFENELQLKTKEEERQRIEVERKAQEEKRQKYTQIDSQHREYMGECIEKYLPYLHKFISRINLVAMDTNQYFPMPINGVNLADDYYYVLERVMKPGDKPFVAYYYEEIVKHIYRKYVFNEKDKWRKLVLELIKKNRDGQSDVGVFLNMSMDTLINNLNVAIKQHLNNFQEVYCDSVLGAITCEQDGLRYTPRMNFLLRNEDISHILDSYIRFLYHICILPHIIKCSAPIRNTPELFKIISNRLTNEKREMGGLPSSIYSDSLVELYEIYQAYYKDTLSVEYQFNEFALLSVVAFDVENEAKSLDTVNEALKKSGIDVAKLLNNEMTANDNWLNKVLYENLDNGVYDNAFKVLKSDFSVAFIEKIDAYMIDYLDAGDWIRLCAYTIEALDRYGIYYGKIRLLQDEEDAPRVQIREMLDKVQTGVDFENFLAVYYSKLGYQVETTKATGDQGADLILEKDGVRTVVQAKYYSTPVGNDAVQEIVAALKYYNATRGVVVTNNTFTKSAIDLAKANDVVLIDGNTLSASIDASLM